MNPDKVRCPGCARDFTLPSNLLAGKTLRLRCPACGRVFRLRVAEHAGAAGSGRVDAAARETGEGKHWPLRESTARDVQDDAAAPSVGEGPDPAPSADALEGKATEDQSAPEADIPAEEAAENAGAPADDASWGETADETVAAAEREEDPKILRRRARRLSRALVLEMMHGQRTRRDKALAEGSLMLEFGEDLRRIWELYVGKVGSETARETSYFREALNEILADGKQLF